MTKQEAPNPSLRVRPYTVTGGRTHSRVDLSVETILQKDDTVVAEPVPDISHESAAILELLDHPLSVAEVSAYLQIPLQVTKVLVGDLVIEELIVTSASFDSEPEARPDLRLLERVLDGLQNL